MDRSLKHLTCTAKGIGSGLLLAAAIAILVLSSGRASLGPEDAERLVRQYLRHQASEQYIALAKQGDWAGSRRYLAEMARVEQLQFESVKVGRLLPDYLLNDNAPSYYTRVVIRADGAPPRTEYYNLGTGALVTGRTSRWVWLFVF